MNPYYVVRPVKGKGLGCIALKKIEIGTMILQEKPQCLVEEIKMSNWINELSLSFKNMNETKQKDYMDLYNRFENSENLNDKDKSKINEWKTCIKNNSDINQDSMEIIKLIKVGNINSD